MEQQNVIPAGDKHENGTETTTSDPQLDGVMAHKEKIAKLEDELETAKHEHRKTMDKLKVRLHTPLLAHALQCIRILSRCGKTVKYVYTYIRNVHVQPHWDHTLLLDSSFLDTLVHVLCVCTVHTQCTCGWCGWVCFRCQCGSIIALYCCTGRGWKKANSHLRESPML